MRKKWTLSIHLQRLYVCVWRQGLKLGEAQRLVVLQHCRSDVETNLANLGFHYPNTPQWPFDGRIRQLSCAVWWH